VPRNLLITLFTVVLSLSAACGDDTSGGTTPEPVDGCLQDSDCDPGEICDLFAQICAPGDSPDVDEPDAEPEDADADSLDTDADTDASGGDPDVDDTTDPVDEPDADVDVEAGEPDGDLRDIAVDRIGADDGGEVELGAGANPWIAFATIVDGRSTVQLARADGTGLTDYDSSAELEESPAWSPTGSSLAVTAFEDSEWELRLIDFADGCSETVVPHGLNVVTNPAFSADGNSIVVEGRPVGEGENALYVIALPAGGDCSSESGCVELTEPASPGSDSGPEWSSDGSTIYFVRRTGAIGDGATFDISSVASGGGDVSDVTDDGDIAGSFAISPDGATIYYPRADGDSSELMAFTIGGSGSAIGNPGDNAPSVFADGTRLAIVRWTLDSDSEIAVVGADGSLIQRVTDDATANTSPAVSHADSAEISVACD